MAGTGVTEVVCVNVDKESATPPTVDEINPALPMLSYGIYHNSHSLMSLR